MQRQAHKKGRIAAVVSATAAALLLLGALAAPPIAAQVVTVHDEASALRVSQSAIGKPVRDHAFVNADRETITLDSFRGKPLIVNLIYTSCDHTCPLVVQTLARAVEVAQDAFGEDSFHVVTVGFDPRYDKPARMRSYARAQGIDLPNWQFLSATPATIDALVEDVGFVFYPSPRGFEHLAQTTILDDQGVVYRHLYGAEFTPPGLVEPMKDLIFGRKGNFTSISGLVNRVRLFCTIYDPSRDRYRFDYSVIVGAVIGFISLTGIAVVVVRAWRRTAPKQRRA